MPKLGPCASLAAAGIIASLSLAPAPAQAQTQAAGLQLRGAVDPAQPVGFDVMLPLRDHAGLEALLRAQHDPASASFHRWISPGEFARRFGPAAASLDRVGAAFAAEGLAVERHTRSLHVSGSAAQVGRALRTGLAMGALPGPRAGAGSRIVATRAPTLPDAARATGAVVLDFGRRAISAHTHSRRVPGVAVPFDAADNRTATTGGYWFTDLKQAYQYPSYQTMITVDGQTRRLDGTGVTIGILISSDIYDSDVQAMFDHENFSQNAGVADPTLFKRVMINGGATTGSDALDEASLDVQQALTGAPGSHVVLYDIPDLSDQNVIAGLVAIDDANEADVVSASFGSCELSYTAAYNDGVDDTYLLNMEHELYQQGNAQGISFLASSGDEAGLECPTANYVAQGTAGSFIPSVSTPAADTDVTAVGGTNLVTAQSPASLDSTYLDENAWSDPELPYDIYGLGSNVSGGSWGAGGGYSTLFAQPSYQSLAATGSTTQRALPDIGMQVGGCPGGIAVTPCDGGDNPLDGGGNSDRSYVVVAVAGTFDGLIGTSVASPELAGATALLIEQYGRVGNLNTYLYAASTNQTLFGESANPPTMLFHRPIPGYDGVIANSAFGPAFNTTTGVGTPIVYRYVGQPEAQPAGLPQTPSNP